MFKLLSKMTMYTFLKNVKEIVVNSCMYCANI